MNVSDKQGDLLTVQCKQLEWLGRLSCRGSRYDDEADKKGGYEAGKVRHRQCGKLQGWLERGRGGQQLL